MRRVALLATVFVTLLAITGCGSDDKPTEGSGSGDAVRIQLDFKDGKAPSVERVPVKRGQKVELVITADEPGELHVHSEPEQELEYAAGTTTETITIDNPGVIDVERHDIDALVLQLEVS